MKYYLGYVTECRGDIEHDQTFKFLGTKVSPEETLFEIAKTWIDVEPEEIDVENCIIVFDFEVSVTVGEYWEVSESTYNEIPFKIAPELSGMFGG